MFQLSGSFLSAFDSILQIQAFEALLQNTLIKLCVFAYLIDNIIIILQSPVLQQP